MRTKKIKNEKNFRRVLSPQMELIYDIGASTGLRISDIITLKKTDIKPRPYIMQRKTKKKKRIFLSKDIRERALILCGDNEYIFSSYNKTGHITRQAVYTAFKKASRAINENNIGTHSMRKKYADRTYKRTKSLKATQNALQHENMSETALYLLEG